MIMITMMGILAVVVAVVVNASNINDKLAAGK